MINEFKKSDMYDFFYFSDNWEDKIKGRLKSYNNDTQNAYLVFNCNNDWENWFNYTPQKCDYSFLFRI